MGRIAPRRTNSVSIRCPTGCVGSIPSRIHAGTLAGFLRLLLEYSTPADIFCHGVPSGSDLLIFFDRGATGL